MTTAALQGTTGTRQVQAVGAAPRRLRIIGGSGPLRWWHARLAAGLTLAGGMLGALWGVAQSVIGGSWAPIQALESYGAGAGAGASAGLVLGLLGGLVLGLSERFVLPQGVEARPLWVRHIRR